MTALTAASPLTRVEAREITRRIKSLSGDISHPVLVTPAPHPPPLILTVTRVAVTMVRAVTMAGVDGVDTVTRHVTRGSVHVAGVVVTETQVVVDTTPMTMIVTTVPVITPMVRVYCAPIRFAV